MNTRVLFLSCALTLFFIAHAMSASDALLVDQFKTDMIAQLEEKTPGLSAEQKKTALDSILAEANRTCPSALLLTQAQSTMLGAGDCPVTDEQLRQTYRQLKQLAGDRPMPVLVEYYKAKFDLGQLNPVQKTIYFNFTSAIYENVRRAAGKT